MTQDLRLPLASLPGFGPSGLFMGVFGRPDCGWCTTWAPSGAVWLYKVADNLPPDRAMLDLSDAATRDRAARWVAGRVRLVVGATAPAWYFAGHGVFRLVGADRGRVVSFAPTRTRESPARVCGLDHYLPSMSDLDWRSTGRLADGCLIVEAEALALVAVHLGSTP